MAFTKVVARLAPFHRTTDDAANELPFTVNVNAGPPIATAPGDSEVAIGAGLSDGSTVTGGLVATRVVVLLTKRRNSYAPAVGGIVTVHVRLVTPVPT